MGSEGRMNSSGSLQGPALRVAVDTMTNILSILHDIDICIATYVCTHILQGILVHHWCMLVPQGHLEYITGTCWYHRVTWSTSLVHAGTTWSPGVHHWYMLVSHGHMEYITGTCWYHMVTWSTSLVHAGITWSRL